MEGDTHFPDYEPDDWESVSVNSTMPMRRTLTAIALRFWAAVISYIRIPASLIRADIRVTRRINCTGARDHDCKTYHTSVTVTVDRELVNRARDAGLN